MRSISFLILSTLLFIGCNAVGDMSEMFEKQSIVQDGIQEEYGLETQVGWNMHNGVLTQVTISFKASEVRNKKVSELETISIDSIKSSFKSTPRAININIVTIAQNSE